MTQARASSGDRLLSSAAIVLEELQMRRGRNHRRVALHLLGVAICLEDRADEAPRLRYSRWRAAHDLRLLALEVGEVGEGELDPRLVRRVGEMIRSVLETCATRVNVRAVKEELVSSSRLDPRIAFV